MNLVRLMDTSGKFVYINPDLIRWITDDDDPDNPITTISFVGGCLYVKGTINDIIEHIRSQQRYECISVSG